MLIVSFNNEIRKTHFCNNIVYQNKQNYFKFESLCYILDDDIILQTILEAFFYFSVTLVKVDVMRAGCPTTRRQTSNTARPGI